MQSKHIVNVLAMAVGLVIVVSNCESKEILFCPKDENELPPAELEIPKYLVYGKKKLTFSLNDGVPTCKNGTFIHSIQIPTTSEDGNNFRYFFTDGSIRIGNDYYRPSEYCLRSTTRSKLKLQICNPSCGESDCVPKCCEIGQAFDPELRRCVSLDQGNFNWSPAFSESLNPHFFIQNLSCSKLELVSFAKHAPKNFKRTPFFVLKNGTTAYFNPNTRRWITLPVGTYCLDVFSNVNPGDSAGEMLAVCPKLDDSDADVQNNVVFLSIVYGLVMLFSCGLYIATILVYIILWRQQKFHMYIVCSYVASLLFLHVFFGASNLIQLESLDDLSGTTFCVIVGAGSHFFILSTFCWLTMINLNLWSTFNSLNMPHAGLSEEQGIIRMIFFSLLSWGLPIIVVTGGLILDNLNEHGEMILLGPSYGETRCLISTEAEGWYLFYPIGGLLICNLVFFALTICRLIVYQKLTRNVIGDRNDKKWRIVNVYMKLLIIAALLWAFELTSWILRQEDHVWYWLIVDVLNLFQSGVIFTMFVCRRSIYKSLEKRCPVIAKFPNIFASACCCGEDLL